ncbi:MAG TPA: DUF998 domain-containing protein [Jiangellaceae bacterium]
MSRPDARRIAIVGLYLAAALALAVAPLLMPPAYSWLEHTTSESAAQGLEGAWLARTGFVLFGFAVLATTLSAVSWSVAARVAHATFGVCMVAAAVFSSRPADAGAPFVATEDTLHSVAASVMGVAFALGVVLVAVGRGRVAWAAITLDAIAVIASVAIPLAMLAWDDWAGLAQRLMFAVAFTWYIAATLSRARRPAAFVGAREATDRAPGARPVARSFPPRGRSQPQVPPGPGARRRARAAN